MSEISAEFSDLEQELHEIKLELQRMFGWSEEGTGDQMI
jgi:hypothetical protein